MTTRSGAQYTSRIARRVRTRQLASSQGRSRTKLRSSSVPLRPHPSAARSNTDKPPSTQPPSMTNTPGITGSTPGPSGSPPSREEPPTVMPTGVTAATPMRPATFTPISVIQPPTSGLAPSTSAPTVPISTSTVDREPLDARIVRNICISEDQARGKEFSNALSSIRDDIRVLAARSDQLDTVIADIQSLRRDVNTLFERSRPPAPANQPVMAPIHAAGTQDTRPVKPPNVMGVDKLAEQEQDSGSFSKMSELVARLERLERAKRDDRDDRDDRDRTLRFRSPRKGSRRSRRHRRKDSDSDSSSGEDARRLDSSEKASSEDDRCRRSRRTPSKGEAFRPKGDRYQKCKPLVATDAKFKEVLDYRYYHLHRTSSSRDLRKIRHQVKQMMVTLRRHVFDGREPILILDFLRRYSNECEAQGMNEDHAHCALEYFLDGTAADHYIAVNNSSTADEGGVTCWPEAVHYLLRSYATHDAIRDATLKFTSLRQGATETEGEYSARLNKAAIRCGNVHSMDEKKTIFVNGLQTAIKALVSRYREENIRATYLELVQFASVEGRTHRPRTGVSLVAKKADHAARSHTPKMVIASANPLIKRRNPALYADLSDASDDILDKRVSGSGLDNIHLTGATSSVPQGYLNSEETSEPSTSTPTDSSHAESDPALYVTPRSRFASGGDTQMVRPQRLTFDESTSRSQPGWQVPRGQPRPPPPGQARIICHACYKPDIHVSPDCVLPLKDLWKVVRNYTAISSMDKARVPAASYYRARAQFADDGK